jgi:AraC-like DNA-binding protein
MSKKRQPAILDPVGGRDCQIVTLARDYPAGHLTRPHFHNRDQLVFAASGVMTVRSQQASWVVPTQRAVWIPATLPHTVAMSGAVAMRTLYLKPRLVPSLPRNCCVINVRPLLRELILHACVAGRLKRAIISHHHLIDVVLDELRASARVPLQLPNLADARARRVARLLMAQPEQPRSTIEICRQAGASKRTIERLFQQEAKMSLGKWRQQLRLMHAVRLLGEGQPVTRAALDSGYGAPSAFSAAFKKALGATPRQYFRSPAP